MKFSKEECDKDFAEKTLILSNEKCDKCEHLYHCPFMSQAVAEIMYGDD